MENENTSFIELVKRRYSVRSYSDKPVEDKKIIKCLQAIIEAHKGKIEVISETDQGTIFVLYFKTNTL
jgi:sensor histidine kinase regulating citrate/malate metabolism